MNLLTCPLLAIALVACQGTPPRAQVVAPVAPLHASVDTTSSYRTAIADYIQAMDTSAAPLPDTVYIGRHPEFPRIELPSVIARRSVRVIDPAVGESEKRHARFAYLNIVSTFTPGQVEFYVVRFAQGLRHQPDGAEDRHLYYRVGGKGELRLERVSR